jgi:hypothetical protein
VFPPLYGPVVQLGVHAGLSSRRSRVQIPSGPQCGCPTRKGGPLTSNSGQIAQSVERTPEKREVVGSIPTLTTSVNQRKRPADVAGGKAKMSICGNDGGNRRIIRLRSAEIPCTLLVTLPKACLGSDGPPKRVVSYFQEIRGTSSRLH